MDDSRIYVFDDVRVDPRAHLVLRAGQPVALEPKAYAVLLFLLEHAGRIVSRDELLDRVWGHRHVTPAVLNRVIAMLRRALGDDADHPRWIRTVYGTGYGFIGSLAVESPASSAASAHVPSAIEAVGPDVLSTSGVADAALDADSDRHERMPISAAARVSERPPPGARLSSAWTLKLMALAALGVSLLLLVAVQEQRRGDANGTPDHAGSTITAPMASTAPAGPARAGAGRRATPVDAPEIRLVVLPFATTDADLTAIATGLTDALIETLARQPQMGVIARESTLALDDEEPQAVMQTLAANRLVRGRIAAAAPGRVLVEIELHRQPARTPWRRRFESPRSEVFRLLGPLLDDLGNDSLPLTSEAGLAALRSLDVVDQDRYWQAYALTAPSVSESADEVAVATRKALALLDQIDQASPGFALGHALRASIHTHSGIRGLIDFDTAARAAMAAADAAIAADPELAEGHLARGFAATLQWRSIEAMGPAQRALELAPHDVRALALMANVLTYVGRLDEAAMWDRQSAALNPLPRWTLSRHGWAHVLAGDKAAAMANFERLRGLVGPLHHQLLEVRLRANFGELAASLRAAGPYRTQEDSNLTLSRASTLQLLGEARAARATLEATSVPLPTAPPYGAVHLRDAVLHGDVERFLERLGEPPAVAQSPWINVYRAAAYAHADDLETALREYGRVFADPRNRELLTYSWFATSNGSAWFADWIALRRKAALPHRAELEAYDAILAAMAHGGVRAGVLRYQQAIGAALADDPARADQLLGEAIAAGWLDPFSLRYDRAWLPYADAIWLKAHRATVARRVDAERAALGLPPLPAGRWAAGDHASGSTGSAIQWSTSKKANSAIR